MKTLKEILEALFDNDTDSNINILSRLYKRLVDKNPGTEKTRELLEDIIKNYPGTRKCRSIQKRGCTAVFSTDKPDLMTGWESLFLIQHSNEVMAYYDLGNLTDTAYGNLSDWDYKLSGENTYYKIPEKLYLEFQELFNEYN